MKENKFLFIFIQEHWLSSYEATDKFSYDFSSYDFLTSSSDTFTPPEDIILNTGPTWHGTALGWHSSVNSFVTKLPIVSTRFCGVKLNHNHLDILSYSVYLPTAGQDDDFLEEISILSNDLTQYSTLNTIIIIGMDSNFSLKSTNRRQNSFKTFVNQFSLETILSGDTPTFHHNNGTSESQIDHIMTNKPEVVTFSMQICKIDEPANLSSHDAIIGSVKVPQADNKIDEVDFSHTYEEFYPKKIIWEEENLEYQGMLSRILKDLMSTFDQPEHLPALAEMSSNMIVMCAEKCLQSKQPKKPQKNDTPKFSRNLREAHEYHNKICKEWRKAGRPTSDEHPAKLAKKESQRNLQRIVRNEETDKAKIQHEDLMETNANNIGLTCQKLKKIRGENINTSWNLQGKQRFGRI